MRLFLALLLFVAGSDSFASSDKFMNLKVSALGLAVGILDADLDFAIGQNWSLGPTVLSWRRKADDPNFYGPMTVDVSALGLRGTYFWNGVYQTGFYFSPIAEAVAVKATGLSNLGRRIEAKTSGILLAGVVGYHWFGSIFNFSIGGGPTFTLGAERLHVDDGINKNDVDVPNRHATGLQLEIMVGAAF